MNYLLLIDQYNESDQENNGTNCGYYDVNNDLPEEMLHIYDTTVLL